MKTQRTLYWISTALFSLWMLFNAYFYLTSEQAKIACAHFGFPDYFRIELAVAKIAGALILLTPQFHIRLKEWAYAGFVITVVSGFIAHLCSGDTFASSLPALLALVILFISYFTHHHLNSIKHESSSSI